MPDQIRESIGHVTVNEHVPTEKFSRFVEERVQAWMSDHHSQDGAPSEYEVAFFDEETLGQVSCLIMVHCGGQLWRAWETSDNPRTALDRSLTSLAVDDDSSDSLSLNSGSTVH